MKNELLILASQSPRRRQLLDWAEVNYEVIVANTDESYPLGLTPQEVALHIAREKAMAVQLRIQEERTILAADTIVVCESEIIGKPSDKLDAIRILNKLSGKTHQVITAVHLRKGKLENAFADVTEVEFHSLSSEQITYYIDQYQPYDKAGAYAIQEWIGVIGIKGIRGDFYNVMGLPVSRVVQALSQFYQ